MEYLKLAQLYKRLEAFSEKSIKVGILARFLKDIPDNLLQKACLLILGTAFYPWEESKASIGEKLAMRAIALATGVNKSVVERMFVKYGDLGTVAEELTKQKRQKPLFKKTLTVEEVFRTLRKIGELEGEGALDKKVKLLVDLLIHAEPLEAKYIVRTVLEDLRIGVGEGLMIEAIAEAYGLPPDLVEYAYSILHDFGKVILIIRKEGKHALEDVKPEVGTPIRVMLAVKVDSVPEAFEIVGRPAEIEYKYDGFRVQIHKKGDKIWLWTRRLENVTKQFPDVVEYIKECLPDKDFIIEGEIVGYNKETGKFLPFQKISHRIKRKYEIEKMVKEIPVEVHLFDIVYYDGQSLFKTPFKDRRKLLERIVNEKEGKVLLAKKITTSDDKEAQKFFEEAIDKGLEGVVFKSLNASYRPGRRVGYMVKLKPVKETLDVVIVGAEWGEGRRAGWLTSFVVAVKDPETGEFLEIGEVGSGIKEKKESPEDITFEELTEILKPYIYKQEGKRVFIKPKIVVEVLYDEIQESPKYSSKFALRFPRIVRLRPDRSPDEIDTLDRVKRLYAKQHGI